MIFRLTWRSYISQYGFEESYSSSCYKYNNHINMSIDLALFTVPFRTQVTAHGGLNA